MNRRTMPEKGGNSIAITNPFQTNFNILDANVIFFAYTSIITRDIPTENDFSV